MKLPTAPFYLSHETTGTKGHLATGEIGGIWGDPVFDFIIECGGNSGLFSCRDKGSSLRLLATWGAFLSGYGVQGWFISKENSTLASIFAKRAQQISRCFSWGDDPEGHFVSPSSLNLLLASRQCQGSKWPQCYSQADFKSFSSKDKPQLCDSSTASYSIVGHVSTPLLP